MAKISIIMPLYNASKYLEETLNSVLKQTFQDFELICINDSSTDTTMSILQVFQKKDERIRVYLNPERKGAAFSRNKGMEIAVGKYLGFLDGDDIFDEMMLERAYTAIENNHADIVMYDFKHVFSDDIYNKLYIVHGEEYINRYCKRTFCIQECEPFEILNWSYAPCNKLYRKSFIQENRLQFQDLSCANDVYFVCMALLLAERIIAIETDRILLYLRDHFEPDRISSNRDAMCVYMALMQIEEELIRRDKFKELYDNFFYVVLLSLKGAILGDKNLNRVRNFYAFLQNEGIQKIFSLSEKYYNIADPYILQGLKKFIENSFESDWYKEENILKIYLHKKKELMLSLYDRLKKGNRKIALWGAGENGRILSAFFREHDLDIEAVIDISKERQGDNLNGYRIMSPQEGLNKVQVIIVSARYIYESVLATIGERDIEVVDINQFWGLV